MDSLTQIVLGAAVGEITLGKKIGNRAMLWGGIAGTIPDLDVMIGSIFMNEINGLAFHRAITHSIFFAITFSFLIAYYTNWLYSNDYHKRKSYKLISSIFGLLFLLLIPAIIILVAKSMEGIAPILIGGLISIAFLYFFGSKLYKRYLQTEQPIINIGYWSWYKLFFWAIFTHPLLDSLTVYGTQLFAPFSNYRVALNNISVADPAYTAPFLFCLLGAAFLGRRHFKSLSIIDKETKITPGDYKYRKLVNMLGLCISSLYILFTFYNKFKVDKIMENTLKTENIAYNRYMTGPTILNNILWSGTAEGDSLYYTGLYSFNDKEKKFKLTTVPKNHFMLGDIEDDHTIETLSWFSKGYYSVMRRKDGMLQINDMRYGAFRGDPSDENSYIFKFPVERGADGKYHLEKYEAGPPKEGREEMIFDLWNRIKGQ